MYVWKRIFFSATMFAEILLATKFGTKQEKFAVFNNAVS